MSKFSKFKKDTGILVIISIVISIYSCGIDNNSSNIDTEVYNNTKDKLSINDKNEKLKKNKNISELDLENVKPEMLELFEKEINKNIGDYQAGDTTKLETAKKYLTTLEKEFYISEGTDLEALDIENHIKAWNVIANSYFQIGEKDRAIRYIQEIEKLKEDDKPYLVDLYIHTGISLEQLDPGEAHEYYQKALLLAESIGEKALMGEVHYNLGVFYRFSVGNYEKAEKHYKKALELFKSAEKLARVHEDISGLYMEMSDKAIDKKLKQIFAKSALKYVEKASIYYESVGDTEGVIYLMRARGTAYLLLGEYADAEILFKEVIRLGLDDVATYNNLADCLIRQGKYKEAQEYLNRAVTMAEKNGIDAMTQVVYRTKVQAFLIEKDSTGELLNTYNKVIELGTKITEDDLNAKIAQHELNAKVAKTEEERELAKEKANFYKIILMIAVGGLIGFATLTTFLVRARKKIKKLLDQQKILTVSEMNAKEEAISLQEEVSLQKEGIEKLLFNSEVMRKELEEKNITINSSIRYTKKILSPRLEKSLSALSDFIGLENAFILFNAKDILSGDFYFGKSITENLFVSVTADCTGHGIPGALLSVLMQSQLEEMVNKLILETKGNEKEIRKLLEEKQGSYLVDLVESMRNKALTFIEGIKYERKEMIPIILDRKDGVEKLKEDAGAGKDGMEMGLTILDKGEGVKNNIYYLGARHSGFLKRKSFEGIEEIKGVKRGISATILGVKNKSYEKFEVRKFFLEKDDIFYTFSDGYRDQFGGVNTKTFGSRRFRNVLEKISVYPMKEQVNLLQKISDEWRQNGDSFEEQVDDILVAGISGNFFIS